MGYAGKVEQSFFEAILAQIRAKRSPGGCAEEQDRPSAKSIFISDFLQEICWLLQR
jgi:hypothetical protein